MAWYRRTSATKRLSIAACIGFIFAGLWSIWRPIIEAGLVGWCVLCAVNLLLAWACIHRSNPRETEASVAAQDQSSALVLVTVVISASISVVAIGYLLATSKALPLSGRLVGILLAIATIVLSWLLIHARFGFHYAHCYYRKYAKKGDEPVFNFPGAHPPDFLDFMYFSFVLGMTSQVSDVTINTRAMRRLALLHGLISFAFNLMIVAFFINVLGAVL